MATTLATFYNRYRDMAVTGVTSLTTSPLSLPSAKLPCKWVHTASVSEAPLRAKGVGGDRVLRCTVVVAVGVMGQDTQANRWADMLAMVDTLNTAIKAVADRTTSWEVVAIPNFMEMYLAVVATIEQPEKVVA